MRVVAGSARGVRLVGPGGTGTRPTGDRVREAVFNALSSMGEVEGAEVVDLFAGTGALGVEALSRGASHATFVERDRAAIEVIRRNLELTGTADRAAVVAGDATRWRGPADLALVDPPYAFDAWDELLAGLDVGLAVLESGGPIELTGPWLNVRERSYSGTVVVFARRTTAPRPGDPA